MIQHYVLTRLKSGLYCFSFSVADELAFYFSFAQCIVLISHNLIVFVVFFSAGRALYCLVDQIDLLNCLTPVKVLYLLCLQEVRLGVPDVPGAAGSGSYVNFELLIFVLSVLLSACFFVY